MAEEWEALFTGWGEMEKEFLDACHHNSSTKEPDIWSIKLYSPPNNNTIVVCHFMSQRYSPHPTTKIVGSGTEAERELRGTETRFLIEVPKVLLIQMDWTNLEKAGEKTACMFTYSFNFSFPGPGGQD
uniref:Uncharacterized protein n=1 Tax=Chromera velia CCMP2878 TaxID=1169474 RepID=A0A0G4HFI7_9ALVE|eukprot:Cvel_26961.t1-p1 / transcript=Cvel_26961.t1 / gene=Cvel_26961 / organism=Chromera_velia_CCMP2878 / gene_product=hypothetical protein / transcript_product=hypothetical protein / location=Cvel_scaffold3287:10847-11227(-) / protein_length=127 / sequence_SO=supercontig / SO=protein_coding / is_pseudo=false